AKAIKDASDDPNVQTNARAIERIANVAKTLGVELDGMIDPPATDPPPVVDPGQGTDSGGVDPPPAGEPSDGWYARLPKSDALWLTPEDDMVAAVRSGRDVLLPAGSTWTLSAGLEPRTGQLIGMYGD